MSFIVCPSRPSVRVLSSFNALPFAEEVGGGGRDQMPWIVGLQEVALLSSRSGSGRPLYLCI